MYDDDVKAVSLLGEALGFLYLCKKNVIKADDLISGEDAYCNALMDIVADLFLIQQNLRNFLDADWSVLHDELDDLV